MLNLLDFPLIRDFMAEGYAEGLREARAEDLLEVLEARGLGVTDDARLRISSCTDLERLTQWFKRALRAATLDEVFA